MLKAVLLLLTLFFSDSHQQCFSVDDAVEYFVPEHVTTWIESRNNFTVSLFKILDKERNQNNVIFSPASVHEALMMAYFGAARDTELSISKVLQLPKDQKKGLIWRIYINQKLMNIRREINNYPLKSAFKLFLSSKLRLRPCMQEKLKKFVETIDYQKDVTRAKAHINKWIEKQTDGIISDHITELSPKTTATFINTVYFRGKWLNEFSVDDTQYIPFRVNTYETRRISMMVKMNVFETVRHPKLGARILLVPYDGNRAAMIIILPDKDLETTLSLLNDETLKFLFNRRNFKSTELKVFIPKFEHRQKMEMRKIMETLGIGNTFTKFADFSGFTGRKEIFLDSLAHEAVIDVDEEGANASDMNNVKPLSYSATKSFMCDHPFAYVMYDFTTRKILFMGTFRDPQQVMDD